MRKFIITVDDEIEDDRAIELLLSVINVGKVSRGNGKDHYTWLSITSNGEYVTTYTKYKNDNEKFHIGYNKEYEE